jgi:chloramphenicol 3-O-phosphotransferase
MPEVIVINGPPGVGKSSVTTALRGLVPGTVAISGAELRAFAPPDARAHLGGGATYRVAGALASAFMRLGAQRVLFEYEFLRASHLAYFRDALSVPAELHVFTLWASLERVAERQNGQPNAVGNQLEPADCYREMAMNLSQLGQVVETERLSAEQVARHIHERLAQS